MPLAGINSILPDLNRSKPVKTTGWDISMENLVAGMPYQTHDYIANMGDHIGGYTGKRNIAFSLYTGHKCRVRLIMRHPVCS